MPRLKFFYAIQNYPSHKRVASVYQGMLSERYPMAESIEDADIVVLHIEPHNYGSVYEKNPALKNKYVISYCVWEASSLPASYQRSLALVQEVWTCSAYCQSAIAEHHPRVVCVPHTIERNGNTREIDETIVRRLVCFDPDNYYFLSIGPTPIRRKNLSELVRVFERTASTMPNARLVIKTLNKDPIPPCGDPRVFFLPMMFSESQMNALYKLADVYVSAHHSEGWGLTLSDAFLFQKPVVATGYSGNLEFMNDKNSFLVRFKENYIRQEDLYGPFTTQMKWADPDSDHLESILMSLYDGTSREEAREKTQCALEDSRRFCDEAVRNIVYGRFDDIRV